VQNPTASVKISFDNKLVNTFEVMMVNQEVSGLSVFPCYAKDNKGLYISMNQDFLDVSCLSSANAVAGNTDEALPWGFNARTIMENDQLVIRSGQIKTFFEQSVYEGKPHLFRSRKSPLLGLSGKIIGVQCVSIPVSEKCRIPLTSQQTLCLKYLAIGFTHKQIGLKMGLSQKTVEHYLGAVKLKLNCKSRAELILQAIERGLIGIF
jgi:DNA-binding CsgD family transcriptional regulator